MALIVLNPLLGCTIGWSSHLPLDCSVWDATFHVDAVVYAFKAAGFVPHPSMGGSGEYLAIDTATALARLIQTNKDGSKGAQRALRIM